MAWVVPLEEVVDGKVVRRSKVTTLDRPTRLESLDDLGLRLADAKTLLAHIQTEIVTRQIERDAERRWIAAPAALRGGTQLQSGVQFGPDLAVGGIG